MRARRAILSDPFLSAVGEVKRHVRLRGVLTIRMLRLALLALLGDAVVGDGTHGQDKTIFELFHGRPGYFVDVGAADGFVGSNTKALERDHGWTGLCIEADPHALVKLSRHRTCTAVAAVVSGAAGLDVGLAFGQDGQGLIHQVHNSSKVDHMRTVTTTLVAILNQSHAAPASIDYLSLSFGSSRAEMEALIPVLVEQSHFHVRALTLSTWPDSRLRGRLAQHGYTHVDTVRFGEEGSLYVDRSLRDEAMSQARRPADSMPRVTVPMGVGPGDPPF